MTRLRIAAQFVVGAAALCVAGVFLAGPAAAHVDPTPIAMQQGTSATVTFGVEHGCNGSPTIKLEMKLPSGVSQVSAPDKAGWKSTVTASTVTWEGGPLDATKADDFALTFTAPTTPGDYEFPVVQTCQTGVNNWIEKTVEGKPEPEFPVPMILVTKDKPTAAELTPEAEDAADTTDTAADADSSSSNTGIIVGVVIAAVVVLGGAGFAITRKKNAKPKA